MATRRKFIPRPDQVVVGHRTYRIAWLTDDEWRECGEDGDQRGVTHHVNGRIHVRLDAEGHTSSDDMMREVLLHEIMHCVASSSMIWNVWDCLDNSHTEYADIEEMLVGGWTPGMLVMMKQNPDVMAYLLDDQEHE